MMGLYLEVLVVVLGSPESGVTTPSESAEELFARARDAASGRAPVPVNSWLPLLEHSAQLGHAPAQAMLGLAHAQGHTGVIDQQQSVLWFRKAAQQGDRNSAFNLVTLCTARPVCIQGTREQQLGWLQDAADSGLADASFELGNLLAEFEPERAYRAYMAASVVDHVPATYNAARMLALGSGDKLDADLMAAMHLFARAARAAHEHPKAAADARDALGRLRPLWLKQAESETGLDAMTKRFDEANRMPHEAEEACTSAWRRGMQHWQAFEEAYVAHASYENAAAAANLRLAVAVFSEMLDGGSCQATNGCKSRECLSSEYSSIRMDTASALNEYRTYLLLSKLAEGTRNLARDPSELAVAAGWHERLVQSDLCRELYAVAESDQSCFNDQLAAAITLRRRNNETTKAEALRLLGHQHAHAATHWITHLQTPRVFWPNLLAQPWWVAAQFGVATALEAAWRQGQLTSDLHRLLRKSALQDVDQFERITSSGAPISGRDGDDADAVGVWSEFMLFDGAKWNERRCAITIALCTVLRTAPEVAGDVRTADGAILGPQGQVTVFRLRPGAHVLPHVGVSNRRLVLQFPLAGFEGVGFRVANEWRNYSEGRAMVFDDSFEHEVVHNGPNERFVLYAVMHHPQLGVPALRNSVGDGHGTQEIGLNDMD
eukprot:CAMPEP_0119380118 /NCGR_PEP_ID=MMETSP1334-20130426/55598_1 /TAXON_ID=127549 /ORGANISM="Calcidiscus leptoporus, Strain RCC1130" /LENGTH=661 /DNA_ID=CAMNT_0007399843 /DNA_START=3 /DNA_END=1988 /DNA_ORIENTATION=-